MATQIKIKRKNFFFSNLSDGRGGNSILRFDLIKF